MSEDRLNDPMAQHPNGGSGVAAAPPGSPEGLHAQGLEALRSHDFSRASEFFLRAVEGRPDDPHWHCDLGSALTQLRRFDLARASYDNAIAIKPDCAEAYAGRGLVMIGLKKWPAAVTNFDLALFMKPGFAVAHFYRGQALRGLNEPAAARASYEAALSCDPDSELVRGMLYFTDMQLCDWGAAGETARGVEAAVRDGKNVTPPFPMLAMVDDPNLHLAVAKRFARIAYPPMNLLGAIPRRENKGRIRVGYYSPDYEDHATMQLSAGIFEAHDRAAFELTAFSFGREVQDDMRARVAGAFDRFIDVGGTSDRDVAEMSRNLQIDIAIDMAGYIRDRRTGIFSHRAAPVQASYLGYPGTMGVDYMDYILADATVIPEEGRPYYTEKVVALPHSYQCNDGKRRDSGKTYTRPDMGLPRDAFVFCCFNNSYKISPATFDGWMRILKRTDGSVLWLLEDNPDVPLNLRCAAEKQGVSGTRLIFAERIPPQDHLARHKLADLFLDTLPYNAHTTASDALWMGLPVLTRSGTSFASRVASSLLRALALPELIAHSQGGYESLAVELAADAQALSAIKRKLAANRLTTPLFDTARFTTHLEAAYTAMWGRYCAGLPPDHITVAP